MTWFFDDPSAVQRLRTAAAKLNGQPFIRGQQDCVWLPEQLHIAAGSVTGFNFPRCDADYSRHVHNDRILKFLRGKAPVVRPVEAGVSPADPAADTAAATVTDPRSIALAARFAELPLPEKKSLSAFRFTYDPPFMPGDLLIMKSASEKDRGVWHMPVMLDDHNFVHCAWRFGVTEGDILAPNYRDILVAVFRARAVTSDL